MIKGRVIFKVFLFPVISQTFVVRNILESIKKGFDVTVISENQQDFSESSQQSLLDQYNVSNKTESFSEPKGKIKRLFRAMYLLFNPTLFYYYFKFVKTYKKRNLTFLFLLNFYLPFRKAQTFHVHFAPAISPLFELKEIGFIRSRIIVSFHGYDGHFLPEKEDLRELLRCFKKHIYKTTVNSVFLKNKLVSKGFNESSISIIPYGINFQYFSKIKPTTIDAEVINLISVGRLVAFKGHKFGIHAVKSLLDKGFKVKYSVIGEGAELNNLKELITELNLESQVTLMGKRNQQEIKEELELNHIFLMTSSSDQTGRREDFGVVSLEAQSMELPIIGFKSGGFTETVVDGETGFLVDDRDIDAMSRSVEKLINDRELLLQMGKQARAHVENNFSFENTTKKYLDLYD